MSLRPGEELDRFRIVDMLGQGGMGQVYRAFDPERGEQVALKVLLAHGVTETDRQRFEREARLLARLTHPHIVPVFDASAAADVTAPWISMRLLSGGRLPGGRHSSERALRVLGEVASALDHAHAQGVLHRDVKPGNVLLDEAGQAYLSDFGISKAIEGSISLTRTGGLVGTPAYMAPEQIGGQPVDERADVYALGTMAYEMLTNRLPFSGANEFEVILKKRSRAAPVPPAAEVPKAASKVVLKALARRPDDRWSSAGGFVAALGETLGAQVALPPAEPPAAAQPTVTANLSEGPTATLDGPTLPKAPRTQTTSWKQERAEDYQRLWSALRDWIGARRQDLRVGSAGLNWVRVDVGVAGFRPTVSHSFDKLTIAVNLMFGPDRERERFAAVLAARDEVERAMGGPVEWAAPDSQKPWATVLLELPGKTLQGDGFPWVMARLSTAQSVVASVFAGAGLTTEG